MPPAHLTSVQSASCPAAQQHWLNACSSIVQRQRVRVESRRDFARRRQTPTRRYVRSNGFNGSLDIVRRAHTSPPSTLTPHTRCIEQAGRKAAGGAAGNGAGGGGAAGWAHPARIGCRRFLDPSTGKRQTSRSQNCLPPTAHAHAHNPGRPDRPPHLGTAVPEGLRAAERAGRWVRVVQNHSPSFIPKRSSHHPLSIF